MKPAQLNLNFLPSRDRTAKPSRGFTLVELLVVIGIIALLIGILLPTLNRARESARALKCLSNIRQILQATMTFAQENKGFMPGRGGVGMYKLNPRTGTMTSMPASPTQSDLQSSGDWIAWQRKIDPIMGGDGYGEDMNITYSALAKYMGVKIRAHATPEEAGRVAPKLDEVYRCPSDNLPARRAIDAGKPIYRYSYSMNIYFMNPITAGGKRFGSTFTGKLASIRAQSERVLLVCEDENTLDDGVFSPSAANWMNQGSVNAVASRHEMKFRKAGTSLDPRQTENARGNVGFCDGHAEFLSRKEAISQKYSGNPTADPVGF